jgi:glutathione synthase/RimK-type ligase-like ATP-grasp enzyme
LLRWNGDQAYLTALGTRGVPTVVTIEVAALDAGSLDEARRALASKTVVVKPPISGAAEGTYRLSPADPVPDEVAGRRMMVQPYEPGIAEEGEWSLILFGGDFSHCLVKQPRPGDFRVQPHLGGTDRPCQPPPGARDLARAALAAAPAPATYARVDIIRRSDSVLAVMELELIEPALFLHHSPDGGVAFADAIASAALALRA